MTGTRVLLLRTVPVLGWLFLAIGLFRPFEGRTLRVLWWTDVALSVGAHAAQVPMALKHGRRLGHSDGKVVAMTMLLGATWWKTQR
ncbi:hypothetical protein [Rhodococcus sp. NPDC059234]|uniref:hypothetical protein n=1 Tax=Rhodococcus sp. NPDC059234 TaxID=3346781 RepID=UPI003673130A